jgi:hypothetical protein
LPEKQDFNLNDDDSEESVEYYEPKYGADDEQVVLKS